MIELIDLRKQYISIKEEIDQIINEVIVNSAFIGGSYVGKFEQKFAKYNNVKYCVGVGNGTDAIEIAIQSLGLKEGGEVLVPANSFIATAEAVTSQKLKVCFIDPEPNSYLIGKAGIESAINKNTVAVIPVHLYGQPCNMPEIIDLAKRHGLYVIEDCSQAHGAKYAGASVGSFGDLSTFSFYPGKNLGAYGDAGAILTNNENLQEKCRMIANHGRIEKYNHLFEGRNSRLDGLQAAILSVKLKYLDLWTRRRREIALMYMNELSSVSELTLPSFDLSSECVWHLFVISCANREELKNYLQSRGIKTGIHYPHALPDLKAYDYLRNKNTKFRSSLISKRILSLPIGEHMSNEDVRDVVTAIKGFY